MLMKEYERELFAQKTPYLQWLKAQEAEPGRQGAPGKQIYMLPFSSCTDSVPGNGTFCGDAVYLFVKGGGTLSGNAGAVFAGVFSDGAGTVLAYADEDYRGSLEALYGIGDGAFGEEVTAAYRISGGGEDSREGACYRGAPWFKPDFSPDTIASFFYVGSVFAIHGGKILEMVGKYGSGISIHELVYRIFVDALDRRGQGTAGGIVHIPKVLYTNDSLEDAQRTDGLKKIRRLDRTDTGMRETHDKVSVVIPSRDNADVLRKCLETLVRCTEYGNYEIIIVDNGSCQEQKIRITDVINKLRDEKSSLSVRYLYQKEEFNFSAMCNAGARLADGTYLVFLNDDIEVMDTEDGRQWLGRMLAYGRKNHVGAVGAKLYYPHGQGENGCYRIQHAGITNMGIGPAHKLGGMADEGCLYHGHNTQNYDMLAVTAACMLVRRSVFDAVGGFDEAFPVAYNDVELCFRLYQEGYFNVQVNEAVLLHHESLTRGQDTSPEKQQRLAGEKRKLYRKHPLLYARDPFYSPNLVQWKKDAGYNTGYLYDFDRQTAPVLLGDAGEAGKRKRAVSTKYAVREFLRLKCPLAARVYDRLTGYRDVMFHIDNAGYGEGITDGGITDNNIVVEGWCAVRNADNADLPRKLWLVCEMRGRDFQSVYEVDAAPKLREDVAAVLEDGAENGTRHTALSGIQVNIAGDALKPGTYRIGVVCRGKLVCDPEKRIRVFGAGTEDKERKV